METRLKILEKEEMGAFARDWRMVLKSPPAYKMVNKSIRSRKQILSLLTCFAIFSLFIWYIYPKRSTALSSGYNFTYPLSPITKFNDMFTYRIGIIADLDTNSTDPSAKHSWFSYFKKGYLTYSATNKKVFVSWDKKGPVILKNNFALKNRGMELSELAVFNGKLLTFDDRTGLVMEINNDKVIPWILLMDGDGRTSKGFKSEWATVKNEHLYVGSMGKEWTTSTGQFENYNPQYIKIINTKGEVQHISWINEYQRIREVMGIKWPGYMIHESGVWSDVYNKWFFLPRRCSKDKYNEVQDEHMGCSVLISADSDVENVNMVSVPSVSTTRGFSSFKFVPFSNDEIIVALRTEELEGKTSTYMTSFTIDGEIIMEDTYVADVKYEGFEFI